KKFNCLPSYKILKEEGLEHQKIFHIAVYIGGNVFGVGTGKNKKEAEQDAAYHALKKLKIF
ncbi:MAG: putative dsRNA-binding protein, partial [Candidatus Caldatribacteriota bacterium]